jgi:hypothetical protein
LRIISFGTEALTDDRPANTVEVVEVEYASKRRHIYEVPVDQIGADHHAAADLPVHAHAGVQRGRSGHVRGKDRGCGIYLVS